ncbi:hypothetical protein J2Y41_004670 [Arthrobacter sp. 1088]|nr:hypothetical protein [Arthrobacter sp. 1088]
MPTVDPPKIGQSLAHEMDLPKAVLRRAQTTHPHRETGLG